MTTAKIKRIINDRGFGFAVDSEGRNYFFHYSAIDPRENIKFEELREGMMIEFMADMEGEKGPKAKPRSLKLFQVNA